MTFDNWRGHPGHFNQVVPSNTTGLGLIEIIKERSAIPSSQIAVFTDKSREMETLLPLHKSLEEAGFHGGPQVEPPELLLYYDYHANYSDCPILQCDHYFGQKVKI